MRILPKPHVRVLVKLRHGETWANSAVHVGWRLGDKQERLWETDDGQLVSDSVILDWIPIPSELMGVRKVE